MRTNRQTRLFILNTLLLLLPLLCLQAQVTIGDNKEPEAFSALELVSNKNTGLRMPMLTTVERNAMADTYRSDADKNALAKGLTIYNTTTNCLEFWNGEKWVSRCVGEVPPYIPEPEDPKVIVTSCIPYMFTYQTINLTVSYTSTPASYLWVVDGKSVSVDANFAYTPPADLALEKDILDNWTKTVEIICQIEVDGGNVVQSKAYEILVVKAEKGTLSPIYVNAVDESNKALPKIAFAHVNLGDENEINPCKMGGWLFQWGRVADGHQVRYPKLWPANGQDASLETIAHDPEDLDANGQVAEGNDRFGKYIRSFDDPTNIARWDWRNTHPINLWGDGELDYHQTKGSGDPCPQGWKVPSIKQWQSIYHATANSAAPNIAGAINDWTGLGTFASNSASGYKLANALYLPAAGFRPSYRSPSILEYVGDAGHYWSGTIHINPLPYYENHLSKRLIFTKNAVRSNNNAGRADGSSVRCILE
ncbi:hypothetical protein D0T84_08860 [Dysgonomonas sp. 521]|uniref:FISUMP domain-containing protein n=1 Tax=Dysgonomonas sp. 521 TaxID=2302932 RepID=UPI0013D2CE07|nr:FISUMP domain-containing protein [Dysgonomonas sp. 521]NDV95026.1 hypothetical protein [Dysgonomonas sp. 521]